MESNGVADRLEYNSARSVFLAWEMLRLWYNAILGFIVVVVGWENVGQPDFRWHVAYCAVAANLCFCAGPVAEGYLTLLDCNRLIGRWLVFFPGMLLASALALLSVISWGPRF